MRRRYSLVMGLVLIAAMLAGQASVSVLAQGTPGASPAASGPGGSRGVQITDGVYVEEFGVTPGVAGNNDLHLLRITAQYGKDVPFFPPSGGERYPAAILHVETGQYEVKIISAGKVLVSAGVTGKEGTCKPDNTGFCIIGPGQTVILREGDSISLKQSTFTVTSDQPSGVKTFQAGYSTMTSSVVQAISYCRICPGY